MLPLWNVPSKLFVAYGIPKLHFVKSIDKDTGRWKRKDKYDMLICAVVCYRYVCPLAYCSHCPAQLQLTKGPMSVVLDKQHSNDYAKGPQVAGERVHSSNCLGSTITTRNSDPSQTSSSFSKEAHRSVVQQVLYLIKVISDD